MVAKRYAAASDTSAWAAQPEGVGDIAPSLLGPEGTGGYNENDLPGD